MAVVPATRELEPREERPIGWDGKRLSEMLEESLELGVMSRFVTLVGLESAAWPRRTVA